MKKIKMLFCLSTAVFMLFTPAVSVISEFSYDTPIPLGAEIDLVMGMSDEDTKMAIENYHNVGETAYGQLEAIRYNFMESSETELLQFIRSMWNKFENRGLVYSVLETKVNKIYILLVEGFDVEQLFKIVPEDVCRIEFVENGDVFEYWATPVYNG